MQFAALCVTLFISITSGLLSGYIASRFAPVEEVFVDHIAWDELEYDLGDGHDIKKAPESLSMAHVDSLLLPNQKTLASN